jgi:hypothetical protein
LLHLEIRSLLLILKSYVLRKKEKRSETNSSPKKSTSKGGQIMAKRKGVSLSVGRGEKSKKGGLTAKGRAKYNRATGSNLQAPVTEKNPTGKRAARRKSFCARMKGVKGPMKDSKGRPTRKALALKRWRC